MKTMRFGSCLTTVLLFRARFCSSRKPNAYTTNYVCVTSMNDFIWSTCHENGVTKLSDERQHMPAHTEEQKQYELKKSIKQLVNNQNIRKWISVFTPQYQECVMHISVNNWWLHKHLFTLQKHYNRLRQSMNNK